MTESPIPIVIGVTGHRNLCPDDLDTIRSLVTQQLSGLRDAYPNSTFWMLNSLAAGADMLCAEIALALGIRLVCPLPMDAGEYAEDFQGEDCRRFRYLLSQSQSFVCPHLEPEKAGRDFLYRQAGLYIASRCHILLALWDGDEEKKRGCGTAAAVFSARERLPHSAFSCANRVSILHVRVNRADSPVRSAVTAQWLDGGPDNDILSRTDRFNTDAKAGGNIPDCPILPPESTRELPLSRLEMLYQTANAISLSFQKRHTGSVLAAAVCCVLLVLAYLLYDELDCRGFLMLYGIVMAAYGLGCRIIRRRQFLERYLQYRLLAEAARVQCYISGLGFQSSVSSCFTWTQKQDAAWVHCAVDAVLIGPSPAAVLSEETAREIWIQDQLQYHTRAQKKTGQQHRLNQRICQMTLLGMIAAFALTFGLEYWLPGFMTGSAFLGLSPQSWLKILWGSISAVTLFAADYFGKLCLDRKQIDHQKMAALFQEADQAFARFPDGREQLFQKLAAEELIENGNWYSYCQESTLSFDL